MGLSLSARLNIFGTTMGIKLTIKDLSFNMEAEGPAIKMFKGSLVLAMSRDRKNRGPLVKMSADPSKGKFSGSFSGYCKLGKVAEADISVQISKTQMQLSMQKVSLFGGVLKG